MWELPIPEITLFVIVIVLYLAAAAVGGLLLRAGGERYKPFLTNLFAIALVLEAIILVFRAVAIKAVPLTGSFESMIVLTMVFGLIYLLFGMVLRQVWFSAMMSWAILVMILLTAFVARPAQEPIEVAATPWAIAHGLAMILGEAMILLAAVAAYIYLIANHRLKQKKILKVIGMVPNLEKLKKMNRYGIVAAFVLVTLGLLSGMGMGYFRRTVLDISLADWLSDPKIVCIILAWLIIVSILVSQHFSLLKSKVNAYLTLAAFILIFFAIVGTMTDFSNTHDFTADATVTTLQIQVDPK